jgi:hypothetical protein
VRAELAATLDYACRCLASAGHTRELLATCTSALEADLRAGRSGALPLALLAYAVGRRAPRLATRTLAVARARARAVEPDIEATVFIVDACYLATRGEIDRSAARARDAVAHADAQLDAARARCIQAQLLRCRGQLDELVRESEQLYEGTRVGDVDRATAIACLAAALHACGRDAEAQARLAESAGCQALELDAAALHAEHAVAASRAGQWEEALDHAQQAEAAMNALSIALWLGQPLLGVSEALLETWRQADRDDARDRCITLAARWRSLVRHQPLLRAPWRLFVGRMAQADGRSSVACRHFEMALQEAQTLSLPLWEGEAHAALAGAIDEPRRADEHRELARGLLGRCGARHALSLLESADR